MSEGRILESLSSILGLETRHGARLEIELQVALGNGSARLACLTRNVSYSGLLIETGSPPKIGTRVAFEIELPDRALVVGRAEVVRHRTRQEEVRFAGLRFVTMDSDSGTRWKRFIENLEASYRGKD